MTQFTESWFIEEESESETDRESVNVPHGTAETKAAADEGVGSVTNSWNTLLGNKQVHRTYENAKWYFVVFNPFNKTYGKDPDWYKFKGIDKCRRRFKNYEFMILTREIDAAKVHINLLICSKQDLRPYDKSVYCNKYKLCVQRCDTLGDRLSVLVYMQKEAQKRTFKQYLDYIIVEKKCPTKCNVK